MTISQIPKGERALQAPHVNHAPGGAYHTLSRGWQGIPGIERAANGRLWATWYSGGRGEGPHNFVLLVTSGDNGKTWTEPVAVVDPPADVRAFDPTLWIDPTGRLWFFWAQSEGRRIFDGRAGVWAITTKQPDQAEPQWSAPRRLCDGVMLNKPTVLSNGEWMMPSAVWSNVPPEIHDLKERFSQVRVSTDEGKTWELRGSVDVPNRSYDEHMIVERRDGSLWMLVRRLDGIGEAASKDDGKTWEANPEVYISGPSSRFFIRRLKSGALLMVYHFDTPERADLSARLSYDDGKTWEGHLPLEYKGAKSSYPDGVEDENGWIYIIRDQGRHKERKILMATFTEEDVRRGRYYGVGSWPTHLVNQIP